MLVPKKVKNRTIISFSNSASWYTSKKKLKMGSLRDICTPLFKAVLFTIVNRWKQPKFPQMNEQVSKIQYVYTCDGILFRLKKDGNPVTCYNMGEPLGH